MNDLEITRLCAEAMGVKLNAPGVVVDGMPAAEFPSIAPTTRFNAGSYIPYEPLRDDAQAMALVKLLGISIKAPTLHFDWRAGRFHQDETIVENGDLNRAICECVAKMQLAKKSERAA